MFLYLLIEPRTSQLQNQHDCSKYAYKTNSTTQPKMKLARR